MQEREFKMRFEYMRTSLEKAQGLQFRSTLDKTTVLVFTNMVGSDAFHSENCRFPFDIAFLDRDDYVIKIAEMHPPTDVMIVPKETKTVLEANLGFLKENIYEGKRFAEWKVEA